MSTQVTNKKNLVGDAVGQPDVRLTITGVDSKGQMFRHSATVLLLDGHRCMFSSKSQPEIESSILAEFDYPQAHPKNRVTQALVRSHELELVSGLHNVTVELELAQSAKVSGQTGVAPAPVSKSAATPIAPLTTESRGNPVIELREPVSVVGSGPQAISRASRETVPSVTTENRGLFPKIQADDPAVVQAAVKSAVTTEINQQMNSLKGWLSTELEKAVTATANARMEKMIGEAVEKQFTAHSKPTLEALNTDVARQVGERIAESQELRESLETIAKKLFAEQTKLAQAASADVEQELTSRAGLIIQSLEGSIAKMEARITEAPARAEQDLNFRAATYIRSLEDKTAELEARLSAGTCEITEELNSRAVEIVRSFERFETSVAESEAKIQAVPSRVDQELSARAAVVIQSVQQSIADVDDKIKASSTKVEEDLILRTSMILRSFEDSLAEMQVKMDAAPGQIDHQLKMRAAAILQSFEDSIAENESRVNRAQYEATTALSQLQALRQEVMEGMLPLQQAAGQLQNMERNSLENMQLQVSDKLHQGATRFETQLHTISSERAVQFAREMEERIAPQRELANETVEKIGAVLQLIQGTARVQQERLSDYSKFAAANFEKEIRAVLLRLANGA